MRELRCGDVPVAVPVGLYAESIGVLDDEEDQSESLTSMQR
jgi:hypothetical protein